MNKKAVSLSLNTMVIMVIVLVVMGLVIWAFSDRFFKADIELSKCAGVGTCEKTNCPIGSQEISRDCPDKEGSKQVCCRSIG